jgi:RNA polymerase sigma-70 factor (sigma-E family)
MGRSRVVLVVEAMSGEDLFSGAQFSGPGAHSPGAQFSGPGAHSPGAQFSGPGAHSPGAQFSGPGAHSPDTPPSPSQALGSEPAASRADRNVLRPLTEAGAGDAPGGPTAADPDLGVLYRRQRQQMVRLARLLTGSFEIAEEVVQEAFLKLQVSRSEIEKPEQYLRATVVNLSRGQLRRRRLERGVPPEMRIVHPGPEVDETWAAVCRLPSRQRAVLALRYYEDLPETQIAELLGCRLGTVKSSLHRALAALRRELS